MFETRQRRLFLGHTDTQIRTEIARCTALLNANQADPEQRFKWGEIIDDAMQVLEDRATARDAGSVAL